MLYAPHIREIASTHPQIAEIGYHCRDYFVKQWDKFKHYPWGVLAHSTHVYGQGTYENGVEKCRAQVTLATAIPESVCRKINLGYRDPKTIRPEDFGRAVDLIAGADRTVRLWEPGVPEYKEKSHIETNPAAANARIRREGTRHLLDAARAICSSTSFRVNPENPFSSIV
mgnify:CR=1 FL=1